MTNVRRTSRAGAEVMRGRRRAATVAARLGTGLREARLTSGMSQSETSDVAGLSQTRFSELERGRGANATLETWATAAAAVGEQLVGFLEQAAGATPPRDIEHLRRQASLIAFAGPGGWQALPELALDRGVLRSRSADVVLLRRARREAVLAEIWDWFDDVGASLRSLDGKRDALARHLEAEAPGTEPWTIGCLFVVRQTRRNVRIVAELRPLLRARFPGRAQQWLRGLADPREPPPPGDGLVWSTSTLAFRASRLSGLAAHTIHSNRLGDR